MLHRHSVIGRVYNKDGELHGNIIGKSGDIVTVESLEDAAIISEVMFSVSSLEKSGYRIEWVNVIPVGVFYGEF